MRRLTDLQLAVLAAVEREGDADFLTIACQFAPRSCSQIRKVVEALEVRGLVRLTGRREYIYAGDADLVERLGGASDDVVRIVPIARLAPAL